LGETIQVTNQTCYITTNDAIIVGESTALSADISIIVIDNTAVADTVIVTNSNLFANVANNITLADATLASLPEAGAISIVVGSIINLGESLSIYTSNLVVTTTDNTVVADSSSIELTEAQRIEISQVDSVTVSDSRSVTISDLTISSLDGIIISDVIVSLTTINTSIVDTVSVGDTSNVTLPELRGVATELVTVQETVSLLVSDCNVDIHDNTTVSDNALVYIAEAGAITISVTDNVIISDSCEIIVTALILVATTNVTITDIFTGFSGVGYGIRRLSLYCRNFNFTLEPRNNYLTLDERNFNLTLEEYLTNDNTESCS
jgi:hypothetical protein